MKPPKLEHLKIDQAETRTIRKRAAKQASVKITINIDGESLATLRKLADESGMPYQRLLNQVLKEGLNKRGGVEKRLQKLETQMAQIKAKLAA